MYVNKSRLLTAVQKLCDARQAGGGMAGRWVGCCREKSRGEGGPGRGWVAAGRWPGGGGGGALMFKMSNSQVAKRIANLQLFTDQMALANFTAAL
jgi:hypothetical protein